MPITRTANSRRFTRPPVEAKSRAANKDHLDVGNQLVKALRKEAAHPRVVMIDENVPFAPAMTEQVWEREVMRSIKGKEVTLTIDGAPAPAAFVIVTNHPSTTTSSPPRRRSQCWLSDSRSMTSGTRSPSQD